MNKKGVLEEIRERLLKGENREDLNKEYKKVTVSRVYNKLEKEGLIIESKEESPLFKNNEKEVLKLLKEVFSLINDGEEYKINITVSKKSIEETEKVLAENEVINPFTLYSKSNKDSMEKELKNKSKDSMINIIKKYFKYNNKMLKQPKDELAKYIYSEVEKVLNIGKCFK
ncbi:hypothetical protein [Clostridium sp. Ade.TY]|uniref:hypothetical protein n=1 Tax=Clostridium sp. Ade.TY TaxID=1391647 RepID=UPI00040E62C1|nr:hypothetical protein [Clostridium sp. Ade.TY]